MPPVFYQNCLLSRRAGLAPAVYADCLRKSTWFCKIARAIIDRPNISRRKIGGVFGKYVVSVLWRSYSVGAIHESPGVVLQNGGKCGGSKPPPYGITGIKKQIPNGIWEMLSVKRTNPNFSKNEMTLDCFILRSSSFFTKSDHPQSRVISVGSWYLTSVCVPRFLCIWRFHFRIPATLFSLIFFFRMLCILLWESLRSGSSGGSFLLFGVLRSLCLNYTAECLILQPGNLYKIFNINIV